MQNKNTARSGAHRIILGISALCLFLPLGGCAIVSVAGTVVSTAAAVAGTVVTTTADVVGAGVKKVVGAD